MASAARPHQALRRYTALRRNGVTATVTVCVTFALAIALLALGIGVVGAWLGGDDGGVALDARCILAADKRYRVDELLDVLRADDDGMDAVGAILRPTGILLDDQVAVPGQLGADRALVARRRSRARLAGSA